MSSRRHFLKCATLAATGVALGAPSPAGEILNQEAATDVSPFGPLGGALEGPWFARPFNPVDDGRELSAPDTDTSSEWIRAVVPGTVLTTLLANRRVPDPYLGLNNDDIVDAHAGIEAYT